MSTPHNARISAVTLSSPNPPELARFYAKLLGWEIKKNSSGWVELPKPQGGIGLSFHIEEQYERPVWAGEAGMQQMQVHLEVHVDNLDAGSAHARECGATMAAFQPQDDVRVYLDPDGHPLCI